MGRSPWEDIVAEYTPSPQSFAKLLEWLGSDREQGAARYEDIRRKLIKFFVCRGCGEPEDLADVTIDRVTRALERPSFIYVGDPALYFYGVAKKVRLEYFRRHGQVVDEQPKGDLPYQDERRHEYLEHCLGKFTESNRKLLLDYYDYEARGKAPRRQLLAEHLGIPLNALRIRLHRVRNHLRECVLGCLNQGIRT